MNATINVPRELAAMEKMMPSELRAKYRELFGERMSGIVLRGLSGSVSMGVGWGPVTNRR